MGYLLFTVTLSKRVDILNVGRGFAISDCLVFYVSCGLFLILQWVMFSKQFNIHSGLSERRINVQCNILMLELKLLVNGLIDEKEI